MQSRPTALGLTPALASKEDVDAALHEMAWLTAQQEEIEARARKRIESIKTDVATALQTSIDGQTVPLSDRYKLLFELVYNWCEQHLRDELPPNKRSLSLAHGELKIRALPAAVALLQGAKPDKAAFAIANEHQVVAAVDKLLRKSIVFDDHDPIPLNQLVSVSYALNKDAIKELWAKRPEIREFLGSLSISVEEGQEQITVAPAALQVATEE